MAQVGIQRQVEILMVEDSPDDQELARMALLSNKIRNRLHIVDDGVEAMAFLRREGLYAEAPRPDLILLDLNLPRKDGRETLAEFKQDVTLHDIPVVILTTSDAETDIALSYDLHANCYITKPVDIDRFIAIVKSLQDFWFSVVRLPTS